MLEEVLCARISSEVEWPIILVHSARKQKGWRLGIGIWGLGTGGWGFTIADWRLAILGNVNHQLEIDNRQSTIGNRQSEIPNPNYSNPSNARLETSLISTRFPSNTG